MSSLWSFFKIPSFKLEGSSIIFSNAILWVLPGVGWRNLARWKVDSLLWQLYNSGIVILWPKSVVGQALVWKTPLCPSKWYNISFDILFPTFTICVLVKIGIEKWKLSYNFIYAVLVNLVQSTGTLLFRNLDLTIMC